MTSLVAAWAVLVCGVGAMYPSMSMAAGGMPGMGLPAMGMMNPVQMMQNIATMYGQAGPAMIQSLAPKLNELLAKQPLSMPGVSPLYDRKTQTPVVWIHLRKAPPIIVDREFYNITGVPGMNVTDLRSAFKNLEKTQETKRQIPITQHMIPSIWGDGYPLKPESTVKKTLLASAVNVTAVGTATTDTDSTTVALKATLTSSNSKKPLTAISPHSAGSEWKGSDGKAQPGSFLEHKVDPEMIKNGLYLSMPLRTPAQETMNIAAVEDTRGIQGVADYIRKKRETARLNNRFKRTIQQLITA